ncbi:MAG: hypothetical protein ACLFVE_15595, partial [Chitinispirillaceae bacterium]
MIQRKSCLLKDVHNGGVQYWTMQNNVLAYNSWYDYDSRMGAWRGSVGEEVDGVNGAKGCGVINPEYTPPGRNRRLAEKRLRSISLHFLLCCT